MDSVTSLIAHLVAIAEYAKDIHYTVSHDAAFSKHLFADLLHDDIHGFIDDIKENIIMGNKELPKSSKVYLSQAISFIPDIREGDDRGNFISISGLIDTTRQLLLKMPSVSRGADSLYDAIGEHLDKCAGLLYMQTRHSDMVKEAVEHDEEACKEKELKDCKCKQKPCPKGTDKQVIKQSDEDAALTPACESALDRVARKLGV